MRLVASLLLALTGIAAGCGKTAPVPPSDTGPNVASDKDRLQGVWAIESFESGNPKNDPSPEQLKDLRFVFESDKFRIAEPGRRSHENFSFVLDTNANPKVMTATALGPDGQPLRIHNTRRSKDEDEFRREEWIYKFDGDTLVVAFRQNRGARPTEFKPQAGTPSRGGPRPGTSRDGKVEPFEPGIPPVLVIRLKKVNEPAPVEPKPKEVPVALMQAQNNLKQIVIAAHNYHDTFGHLPQDITDKNGKAILSWRVAILPFIEQANLYKMFKLDEPWDSENNKTLSQTRIKTYESPQANPPTPQGMTHYKAFVGPGTVFEPGKRIRIHEILDGTSNTILVVEAGDAVHWAKPDDIPFDPNKPLPKLALPGVSDFVNVAMCDGSVRTLNMKTVSEKTLKSAITRNDGQVLSSDW